MKYRLSSLRAHTLTQYDYSFNQVKAKSSNATSLHTARRDCIDYYLFPHLLFFPTHIIPCLKPSLLISSSFRHPLHTYFANGADINNSNYRAFICMKTLGASTLWEDIVLEYLPSMSLVQIPVHWSASQPLMIGKRMFTKGIFYGAYGYKLIGKSTCTSNCD